MKHKITFLIFYVITAISMITVRQHLTSCSMVDRYQQCGREHTASIFRAEKEYKKITMCCTPSKW